MPARVLEGGDQLLQAFTCFLGALFRGLTDLPAGFARGVASVSLHHALTRELESGDGLLASDGRELPQEFMERVTSLEVVEQRLQWHSCANEDWRSAEDLGVAVNDRQLRGHDAARSFSLAPRMRSRR